jgi:hypothetical protein
LPGGRPSPRAFVPADHDQSQWSESESASLLMYDIFFLAVTALVVVLSVAYVVGCERL